MTVETATYFSQLNVESPPGSDPKSEGSAQLKLIKSLLRGEFPGFNTAAHVTVTQAQINDVTNKSLRAGDTYTGTHDYSGATVVVATPTTATMPVTKAYADGLAFSVVLPGVTASTAGKSITNDGATSSWGVPRLSAQQLFYASF